MPKKQLFLVIFPTLFHSMDKRKRFFWVTIFVLTILATVIFPVMSQGLHSSCQEPFVKIAKFDENNKTILTSCVTSNVIERFIELGWHITPVNSSRLHLVPNEEITMVAKEVIEDTEVVTE